MSISQRLLSNVRSTETAVRIERATADPINGVAKVLFTTNVPANRADLVVANAPMIEAAFRKQLGDKAHLITSSLHKAEKDGWFYGFIKVNQAMVEHEDAVKEGSGYTLVAANCFAGANDDIWEVREDASGKKILLRNSQEDLTELFSTIAPPSNMSVAAATMPMNAEKLEFASIVTFLDPTTEKYHEGVVVDTSTVIDMTEKKAKEINTAMVIASSNVSADIRRNLSARMGNEVSTYKELASTDIKAVFDYLETLYGRMPEFLAAYKEAVRRLLNLQNA